VLVICCLSLFIVGLDATVVNIALPSIGRDLHGGVSGLQWTIDGYTLVLASLLMLAGATADRVGRRRVFVTGLAVFGIGSGLCSLAPSLGALVAFRMLQAAGGSMLNPVAMSIIANTYTERAERARAIGVWGGAFGVSMALGPVLGGVLVDAVGWRGAFWVNIPVCLAALVLTLRYVPESRAPSPRRPDPVGQVLITAMLGTLTYAIIEGPARGWTSPVILVLFAASGLCLAALVLYEGRCREPVIDLRFFRSAPFTGSVLTAITASGAFAGFLLLATLYLQDARGLPPLRAGLHLLPMAVVMAGFSFWSGRILARRNALLPVLGSGFALITAGILLSRLNESSPTVLVLLAFMVFGVGAGLVNAPITNAAVSGMPPAQAGVASAVASTSRQVGQSLGVAVCGSIVAVSLHGSLRHGFVAASHGAWLLLAGCGGAVALLGIVTGGSWAMRTATRTAAALSQADAEEHADGARPAAARS
jgi:EmrB/QacA subfamily drug resistance transporter